VQLLTGSHHASGFSGNPEVIQVFKVHRLPLHPPPVRRAAFFLLRYYRSKLVKNTNLHEA
jgi:hypothetical protein